MSKNGLRTWWHVLDIFFCLEIDFNFDEISKKKKCPRHVWTMSGQIFFCLTRENSTAKNICLDHVQKKCLNGRRP